MYIYIYRFIYKTHLPPRRWEELGKVEEVEKKGSRKKWRVGRGGCKGGKGWLSSS
jgi:hypothetical protein